MRDADYVFDPALFVLRPNTSCGQALPLLRDQALGVGDILRATSKPGQGPWRRERKRISKRLHRWASWGMVAHAGAWGWTATHYGRDLVDAMRAAMDEPPPSPIFTPANHSAHQTGDARHVG